MNKHVKSWGTLYIQAPEQGLSDIIIMMHLSFGRVTDVSANKAAIRSTSSDG